MGLKRLHDRSFDSYRNEILEQNYVMLRATSLGAMIISAVLVLLAIAVPFLRSSFWVYAIWGAASLGCFWLCLDYEEFAKKQATKMIYVMAGVFLVTASISGTMLFRQGNSAMMVGLLVVVPFLLLDQLWRFYTFQIAATLLFCVLSFYMKTFEIALVDVLNTVGFTILACVVGTYNIRLKMSALRARALIIRQRDTDQLTGLSTRGAAETVIANWLETGQGTAAFFLLDIDYFKSINDSLGHLKGDQVLVESARQMRDLFRRSDCVARFGGDEFLIFMTNVSDVSWLFEKAEALNGVLCQTVTEGEQSITVSASIGMTLCTPGESFDDIYGRADRALYAVKEQGRNGYRFYDSSMEQSHLER